MGIKQAESSNILATRENLVETEYVGTHSRLVGTKGEAYYHLQNKWWAYRPFGWEKFVKITNPSDLECNAEMSWIKCEYKGVNRSIQGTQGKATYSEGMNAWIYKPEGTQETYRVVNDASFVFHRDKDVAY